MSDTPTPDTQSAPEFVEPTDQIQAMKLPDKFDGALLGADICGRFTYSLVLLTEMAMSQFKMDADTAKQYVAHQVVRIQQENGNAAPLFIDDELVRGEPRFIVAPNGEDVPKDILVPGQNHGATKGFLAPNDLGKN